MDDEGVESRAAESDLRQRVRELEQQLQGKSAVAEQRERECARLRETVNDLSAQLQQRNAQIATLRRHLEELASIDEMTGLPTRAAMARDAHHELLRAARGGTPFALLLVDIDGLHEINGARGHAAGDHVLLTVSARVRGALRQTDRVGRYDGEEFCVLLPDTDWEAAQLVAERIRAAVGDQPMELADGASLSITVSIGGACQQTHSAAPEDDFRALLRLARSAATGARRTGGNRVDISEEAP